MKAFLFKCSSTGVYYRNPDDDDKKRDEIQALFQFALLIVDSDCSLQGKGKVKVVKAKLNMVNEKVVKVKVKVVKVK